MEDNLENRPVETTPAPEPEYNKGPDIGFPLSQHKPKSKSGVWIFIIVLIIILVGGLVFFLSKGNGDDLEPSPTPDMGGLVIETPENTPEPTPVSTPSAAEKAKIKIEIQNGTGITGEAAYLQGILKGMGYANFTVGNSVTQDNINTTISFSEALDKSYVQEITSQLELIYQQVNTQTSSSLKTDILIVTGLKKGSTAKPTTKPSPSLSPSPSPSATP